MIHIYYFVCASEYNRSLSGENVKQTGHLTVIDSHLTPDPSMM